jgi:hypothetical protein
MPPSAALDRPDEIKATPRRRPSALSVIVLVFGLVLTGVLAQVSSSIHDHNEDRLLTLELHQAASVVTAAIPSVQIPLTSAAELAQATNGNPQLFRTYIAPYVGATGSFASASLWRMIIGVPKMSVVVGAVPEVSTSSVARAFLRTQHSTSLGIVSLLAHPRPGIGYVAASSTPSSSSWIVYAERILPKNRQLRVTRNSAFSQLNYAIYLGSSTAASDLLEASANTVPFAHTRAIVRVPFGNTVITLVATPNGELGGTLLARLTLIVAVVGTLLSLAAAFTADYLVRRRRQAEWLASENRRMYSEQRSIAEVLQHALLPQVPPEVAGVETAIRYVAGSEGTDVGGDWYDVIPLDDSHFVFVLGDVSGRGVEAATVMARLHFAIRAYVVQGDAPEIVVGKLGRLLDIDRDKSFATILLALVDVAEHTVTLVNAGHPPPLLLHGNREEYMLTKVFPPVGVGATVSYEAETLVVPERATIVAFTDGLVERRDETLDAGFERLLALVAEGPSNLDDLLTRILTGSSASDYHDDTAILAVRWKN